MRLRESVLRLFVVVLLALAAACNFTAEGKRARHTERGDRYYDEKQYREAIIEYKNVLQAVPNDLHAIKRLGFSTYALGDFNQAFPYLVKAREYDPEDLEVRIKLAALLALGLKPTEAKKEVDFILDRNAKDFDALQLKGALVNSLEEVKELLAKLEAIEADHDHLAKYHLTIGKLYQKIRDIPKAEEAFRKALNRDSKSIESRVAMGDLLLIKKEPAEAEKEYLEAAQLAPLASPVQLKVVDFYLASGRPEEARKRLQELIEKAPEIPLFSYRLAEIALMERKYDECLEILDVVLRKKPSDAEARLIRGRVYLAKEETPQAIQELQEVVKVQPNAPAGHYQLALAYLQAGDTEQAKSRLQDAVRLRPNFADAVIRLAELEIQGGAPQRAVDSLEKLLEDQPNLVPALVVLGSAYLAQGEAAKAAQMYRRGIELSPKDPRLPYLLGLASRAQNRNDEAEKQFIEALKLSPGFVEPLANLIAMDFAARKPDSALDRAKRQVGLQPRSAGLHFVLGKVHLARKETRDAEKAFLKAIELEPNLPGNYVALAELYITSKEYDQALNRLKEALQINPRNVSALMMTGLIQQARGETANAQDFYEQILSIKPDFAPAANNLAYLYGEHGGDLDRAVALAYRARAAAPEDPHIADTLGWLLYRSGRIELALTSLQLSAAKLPDNAEIQYHLGIAYYKQGNKEGAKRALQKALSLSDSFRGADEARQVLAGL